MNKEDRVKKFIELMKHLLHNEKAIAYADKTQQPFKTIKSERMDTQICVN
jgi:hypothetical protein